MNNNICHISGLYIPTEDEAKDMVNQYPRKLGTTHKILPLNYDLELAAKKGLCSVQGFGKKYLYMQAIYRKALEKYLKEQLDLEIYDNMLAGSGLKFLEMQEERKNFYQKYSTFEFRYIYLRNNLPIEQLDIADLIILEKYIQNSESEVTDELLKLVSRTYHHIITIQKNNMSVPVHYSNDGRKIVQNGSLIFEIAHAHEVDERGNYVNRENEHKKNIYLVNEFVPQMQKRLTEKVGYTVIVFLR